MAALIDAIGNGGDRTATLAERSVPGTHTETGLRVLADEWNDRISSETFWRGRRSGQSAGSDFKGKASRLQGPEPPPSWFILPGTGQGLNQGQSSGQKSVSRGSGYRTVCVRLCDGFFFPVSFGVSDGSLGRDQDKCSNSCPGARLYYGKVGSDDADDMVDLDGKKYSRLPNANLFRTQYVESCKCKPHAWEEASAERHRIYALEALRRKGDRTVVAELEELKSKRAAEQRVLKGRRESSNSRKQKQKPKQKAREEATLQGGMQVASSSPADPAPRSDASRGQGGERHTDPADGSSATIAIKSSVRVADASGLTLALTSPAMVVQADPDASPAPAAISESDATGQKDADQSATLTGAGSSTAASGQAEADEQAAKPAVAAPTKRTTSRRKTRDRQAQAPRPGMMRLGAGSARGPVRQATTSRGREPSGDWVRRTLNLQ